MIVGGEGASWVVCLGFTSSAAYESGRESILITPPLFEKKALHRTNTYPNKTQKKVVYQSPPPPLLYELFFYSLESSLSPCNSLPSFVIAVASLVAWRLGSMPLGLALRF